MRTRLLLELHFRRVTNLQNTIEGHLTIQGFISPLFHLCHCINVYFQKENASEDDILTMKADSKCIISSPPDLPVALSDLILLFRAALKHRPPTAKGPFSQRFPDGADNQLPRDKLKLTVKKLEFYLAWVVQGKNILSTNG